MRTKRESLSRLRSLSRQQLHKLSEGFSISENKHDPKLIAFYSMAGMALYASTVILISWI